MSEVRIISVKIPEEVYQEMALRIPEGDRSNFIREAISEKLQKTPKADKLLALEERMGKIEQEFGQSENTSPIWNCSRFSMEKLTHTLSALTS